MHAQKNLRGLGAGLKQHECPSVSDGAPDAPWEASGTEQGGEVATGSPTAGGKAGGTTGHAAAYGGGERAAPLRVHLCAVLWAGDEGLVPHGPAPTTLDKFHTDRAGEAFETLNAATKPPAFMFRALGGLMGGGGGGRSLAAAAAAAAASAATGRLENDKDWEGHMEGYFRSHGGFNRRPGAVPERSAKAEPAVGLREWGAHWDLVWAHEITFVAQPPPPPLPVRPRRRRAPCAPFCDPCQQLPVSDLPRTRHGVCHSGCGPGSMMHAPGSLAKCSPSILALWAFPDP
jgi:hypothetical protein